MEIQLITFGKIAETISGGQLEVGAISNTEELRTFLEQQFPALSGTKYALAVDKKIVQSNVVFAPNAVIAIMPPFSGG